MATALEQKWAAIELSGMSAHESTEDEDRPGHGLVAALVAGFGGQHGA